MKSNILSAVFVAAAVVATVPAQAQDSGTPAPARSSDPTYWPHQQQFWNYFGATVGRAEFDCCNDKTTAFKVFGGGRIKDIFGAEIGYVDLGKSENALSSTRARGLNLSLVLNAPIGETVGLFAKAGTLYSWTEISGAVPEAGKDNGFGFSWGVGATMALSRNWQVRVDWDRYRLELPTGRDADLLTAGLQYRF